VVRTVWIQRTGEAAYVQRHLPTGGVEIHFPIGGHPQLVGPLTGPEIEVIPAHTTIVGVRFQPGDRAATPAGATAGGSAIGDLPLSPPATLRPHAGRGHYKSLPPILLG
jgi:hypothetical protein